MNDMDFDIDIPWPRFHPGAVHWDPWAMEWHESSIQTFKNSETRWSIIHVVSSLLLFHDLLNRC